MSRGVVSKTKPSPDTSLSLSLSLFPHLSTDTSLSPIPRPNLRRTASRGIGGGGLERLRWTAVSHACATETSFKRKHPLSRNLAGTSSSFTARQAPSNNQGRGGRGRRQSLPSLSLELLLLRWSLGRMGGWTFLTRIEVNEASRVESWFVSSFSFLFFFYIQEWRGGIRWMGKFDFNLVLGICIANVRYIIVWLLYNCLTIICRCRGKGLRSRELRKLRRRLWFMYLSIIIIVVIINIIVGEED